MPTSNDFWQLDYALSRLKDWKAVAVALYKNEVGGMNRVLKKGKAWESRTDDNISPEQFKAITAKTAYTFEYKTPNTAGTLMLLVIPNEDTAMARKVLFDIITKELESGIRDKRQRRS